MLYQISYLILDQEKYESEKPKFPNYVLCNNFDDAMSTARPYESDVLQLYEVKVVAPSGSVVVSKDYKLN